jgi:hypothetical protein
MTHSGKALHSWNAKTPIAPRQAANYLKLKRKSSMPARHRQ